MHYRASVGRCGGGDGSGACRVYFHRLCPFVGGLLLASVKNVKFEYLLSVCT